MIEIHCVKSVQIRSFSWSVFSRVRTEYGNLWSKFPYSVRILENTDQKKLRIWTLLTQRYFHANISADGLGFVEALEKLVNEVIYLN